MAVDRRAGADVRPLLRRAAVIGTVLLAVVTTAPRSADAADRVLARDNHIARVLALDGVVVYYRENPSIRPQYRRAWMRIVNGHVRAARAMTRRRPDEFVSASSIGVDSHGRVVVPFVRYRIVSDQIVSRQWWIYDVAADRSRPVRGLLTKPDDCSELSVWGSRAAYSTCRHAYLRAGGRTRRVPIPRGLLWWPENGAGHLTLRGATLFGQVADSSDGIYLTLFGDASGFCNRLMPGLGGGDAGPLSGWWLSRHYLSWTLGDPSQPLVGARLRGGCRVPGPTGLLFAPPASTSVLAVDDRYAYYGDANTILRHRLPSQPVTSPPPNDNFENATPLNGDAPVSIGGVLGAATAQPGEPPFLQLGSQTPQPATHTVWYAFRPSTSQRVRVSVDGIWPASYGIFTGSSLYTLTGTTARPFYDEDLVVDAVAGETYWIAVASGAQFPDFRAFTLTLTA